jgi:hypothetical protein
MAFGDMHADIYKAVLKSGENGNGKRHAIPRELLYLVPGELKALAMISAGLLATAPTGGESWIPPQHMFEYFRGRSVVLLYDHDVPKRNEKSETVHAPGRDWAVRMMTALQAEKGVRVGMMPSQRTDPPELREESNEQETPFEG